MRIIRSAVARRTAPRKIPATRPDYRARKAPGSRATQRIQKPSSLQPSPYGSAEAIRAELARRGRVSAARRNGQRHEIAYDGADYHHA